MPFYLLPPLPVVFFHPIEESLLPLPFSPKKKPKLLNNNREDIIRAFLEGIALNTKWLMTPVEKFLGKKVSSINIVGGGAQSDVWCQIFADVMDVEIKQVAEPVYANARGAAWIGAVGLGEISFNDVPKLVKIKQVYVPDNKNRSLYYERFDAFKTIYKQMKGVYKKLNG